MRSSHTVEKSYCETRQQKVQRKGQSLTIIITHLQLLWKQQKVNTIELYW